MLCLSANSIISYFTNVIIVTVVSCISAPTLSNLRRSLQTGNCQLAAHSSSLLCCKKLFKDFTSGVWKTTKKSVHILKSEPRKNLTSIRRLSTETACSLQLKFKVTKITLLAFNVQIKNVSKTRPKQFGSTMHTSLNSVIILSTPEISSVHKVVSIMMITSASRLDTF